MDDQRNSGTSVRFDTTPYDSFGYQLAYSRDTLAKMTQVEFAQAVSATLDSNAASLTAEQVICWEKNQRLEEIADYTLHSMVDVITDVIKGTPEQHELLYRRLHEALAHTRRARRRTHRPVNAPNAGFGEWLGCIRETVGLTQSAFADRLQMRLKEEPVIDFTYLYNVERGQVPSLAFLRASMDVLKSRGVPYGGLARLAELGEELIRQPFYRPLNSLSTDRLRTRAAQILLCELSDGEASVAIRRPNSLVGKTVRTYRGISQATGIPARVISACFSESRSTTLKDDARKKIIEYLLSIHVDSRHVQEFDMVVQIMNGRSRQRS